MNNFRKAYKTKINGIWFLPIGNNQVKCASCLYLQPTLKAIYDKNGIVKGWELLVKDEEHAETCLQNMKKIRDPALAIRRRK